MSATHATAAPAERIEEARKAWKAANLTPLWETTAHRPGDAVPKAHLWKWQTLRPLLDDAIECASMQDAERRGLALTNPHAIGGGENTPQHKKCPPGFFLGGGAPPPPPTPPHAPCFFGGGGGAPPVCG